MTRTKTRRTTQESLWKDYSRKLMENCKSQGGPCMLVEKLQTILLAKPDIQDCIAKAELAYFHQTHKSDIIAWLDFFKFNKISNQERLENLMILLSERPTNADVLQMITRNVTHKPRKDATTLLPEINYLCRMQQIIFHSSTILYAEFQNNVREILQNFCF